MLNELIAVLIIVSTLTIISFMMLKRITSNLDENAKKFFLRNTAIYDDLILEKEKKLKEINSKAKGKNEEKSINEIAVKKVDSIDVNLPVPYLKENDFYKKYKSIKEGFEISNRKIIFEFLNNIPKEETTQYFDFLINIKSKITPDVKYKLLSLERDEQLDYFSQILDDNELMTIDETNYDLQEFLYFIEKEICENDPTIYIRAGTMDDSLEKIDKRIKIIYDEEISIGLLIIYKGKSFDYSIS